MLPSYEGVLRGDRIEWSGDVPLQATPGQAFRVFVTVLGQTECEETRRERGRRMAAALEGIAALPAEQRLDADLWEAERREERPLPGREA
jgi:hypothetical protein